MLVIPAVPGTGHQRGESAPKSYNVSVSLVNDVDILMSFRRCNLDDLGRCQYPRIDVIKYIGILSSKKVAPPMPAHSNEAGVIDGPTDG